MTCSFPLFVILWNKIQGQSTPAVHLKIARFLNMSREEAHPRVLLMAFRACGKSSITGLYCAWCLWRDPALRILVLSADLALARKMVRNVKRIIEKHPMTCHLKPPHPDQWGAERFTVVRPAELRDPSMLAKGVTTNLTGTRADLIICDDVEVPRTSDSLQKRLDLRERLRELDYILTPAGQQIYIGTPHHFHSIYADKPRAEYGEEAPFLDGFKRLVIPVLSHDGVSVWPERFTMETIDSIRRATGPMQFQSQMMCEPVNMAESRINPDLLHFYEGDAVYREAGGRGFIHVGDQAMASVAAWWDPAFGSAGGDRSVLAILYTGNDGRYWLHHLALLTNVPHASEDEATQQCRKVAATLAQFHVPSVAIETNGIGKFLPAILRREIARHVASGGAPCGVREVTSRRPKSLRILEAFDAVLAARALYVHRSVLTTPFVTEMRDWRPHAPSQKDDCLDAVAGALSLAPVRMTPRGGESGRSWIAGKPPHGTSSFDI
ncbi:MAG: phage terminase large subunit [Pseudobdellovibrionaceae bacterium]